MPSWCATNVVAVRVLTSSIPSGESVILKEVREGSLAEVKPGRGQRREAQEAALVERKAL